MSILSYQTIKDFCGVGWLIEPWSEKTVVNGKTYGLSECGYDLRIAQDVVLHPNTFGTWLYNLFHRRKRVSFVLASTVERFKMPDNVAANIVDKSTWARQGLAVQNTFIEPGWAGWLTLELSNHGPETLTIKAGTPIAQAVFTLLDKPTQKPYTGKYSDQPNRPVAAIQEETTVPWAWPDNHRRTWERNHGIG